MIYHTSLYKLYVPFTIGFKPPLFLIELCSCKGVPISVIANRSDQKLM